MSTPGLKLSNRGPVGKQWLHQVIVAACALVCLFQAGPAAGELIIYDTPAWRKEVARGYFPYHRLVRSDFPIDDEAHPKYVMYTSGFFHYTYRYDCTETGGRAHARITHWRVRSGFNRNKSSRKSWFKSVESLLPHEQGHLDINELQGRRLAHLSLDELPAGEGETSEEAIDDLQSKLKTLSTKTSKEDQAEQDAYDAETAHGKNESKQKEATAALQKRLKKAGISYAPEKSKEE